MRRFVGGRAEASHARATGAPRAACHARRVRRPLLLACLPALLALGCSDGSTIAGSGPHDDSAAPAYAACQDSFVPVYLNDGPTATDTMVTAGDGLFYLASSSSILYFPPGATVDTPPATVVAAPPEGSLGIDAFWASGDSLLLVTADGLATVPTSGGALTYLTTGDDEQAMATALHFVQDGTTIYGAFTTVPSASGASPPATTPITLVSQSVSGGPVGTLATIQAPGDILAFQLFDTGPSLWVQDDEGDVFSIAKSDGTVQKLGNLLATGPSFLFAPDGTAGMYGATQTYALASYGFDGTATPLFGAGAPTFLANAAALDTDGTLYVAGEASSSPTTANPAIALVPRGGTASLLHCAVYTNAWIAAVTLGTTVGYAAVPMSGELGIVRFAK